ncbi:VOC family protein [Protaetiibacter mangrovi]|uniref:VOC family protein n=1 Tax=Protaetiibacter mangrovi TaxID=2970926 RepID=A0ABT1ZHJ4_9MICO|nr:VOC family protein [Protaetiibacter mangrovi]MCS0500190.1 VOC family protein [Protaetiibacter mangrovi]
MAQKVTPYLWFQGDLQDALDLYTSVFDDAEVLSTTERDGGLFAATFRMGGIQLTGFNAPGGPRFTDAMSLFVDCADQAEVDHYWDALLAGGGTPTQCGWLVDRFGVSWQVVPRRLMELLEDPDPERAQRATAEMLTQVKLDVARLEAAADGTLG